jgi:hypothetical protein
MLPVLQFIFSSFWIWLGTVILVFSIGAGFSGMVRTLHVQK